MSTLLAPLLSFLLLYKYPAIFIVVFVAALALPLPTNSILLAAGAFASGGYFNFAFSLIVAVSGNILGDLLGYFIAKKYGRHALQMLHLRIPPYLERLERYVNKHPGTTVFFTRFFGAADPLTNILAGFANMPFGIFLSYDIFGNFISIGSIIWIGYYFGDNWETFTKTMNLPTWAILWTIVFIFLIPFLIGKRRKRSKRNI